MSAVATTTVRRRRTTAPAAALSSEPLQNTAATAERASDLAAILQTYNDVTERLKLSHEVLRGEVVRLRDEIERKNKELERSERLAALGQMAAGVAHEIRNPLGGVRLYASLLERDLHDRPAQRELVRRLETGVRNMESIVGDILAFAGDAEPRARVTSIGVILDRAIMQVAPQAELNGTKIKIEAPDDATLVHCDAGQIERALINILLNACEAAGRGGCVWVRTECRKCGAGHGEKEMCRVTVEDSGPGFAPDAIGRLFNPFYTTKETGTGLGLAIVHRIAEANGGRISAANRPEGGAAFVLSIPPAKRSPGYVEV